MILDVDFVPQPGGEAAAAMVCLERTAPLTPGAQGVVYDTALRGVHHQQILRHLGLIPINRVAAAKAGAKSPRRNKAERRTEKSTVIETKTIARPDGTETITLYARAGALGIGRLTEDGEHHFDELRRTHTIRRADKAGTYRWYDEYALPDDLGGGQITVRLHGDDQDTKRKLNRTENLRPDPAERPRLRRPLPASATTPSPSTATSTTPSSSGEPTPSATAGSSSTSWATPSWSTP